MQLTFLFVVLIVALLVLSASSHTAKQESGAPPLPAEAKRLEAWVGTWDAEVSMMGETSQGSETCRIECGGHWLVTEHSGSFLGGPFQGRGLTGFDAAKGTYAGVWVDSSGSPMSLYTDGRFSADGKTFSAEVEGLDPTGKPARFEYRSSFPEAKKRTFEIFQLAGGKKELVMSIRYSKRS